MTATAIDRIGLLVTNDAELGEGPLGLVRDAALVIEDGAVAAIEPAGVAADERFDAGGRCVIPGFVDSHTHLVFAGDRAEEFAARMAGAPYEAGGIRVTTEATRAASDDELLDARRRAGAPRGSPPGSPTWRSSRATASRSTPSGACAEVAAAADRRRHLPGRPRRAGRVRGPRRRVRRARLRSDARACAAFCRWIDVFCERGAFDAEQSRAVLEAGAAAGLGLRVHGNQLGPGPGARLAVEMGAASVDHCTYLDDADIEALAGSDTVATFLPATDFSTRQPYPDARRAIDAGVAVAIATNTNPGSSYTTSMSFCIALAVRDMGMTIEEAVAAATIGGANALRRDDLGHLRPAPAPTLWCSTRPTTPTSSTARAYRLCARSSSRASARLPT